MTMEHPHAKISHGPCSFGPSLGGDPVLTPSAFPHLPHQAQGQAGNGTCVICAVTMKGGFGSLCGGPVKVMDHLFSISETPEKMEKWPEVPEDHFSNYLHSSTLSSCSFTLGPSLVSPFLLQNSGWVSLVQEGYCMTCLSSLVQLHPLGLSRPSSHPS